jgi:zinc transport system substrate-binding protein
MLVQMSRIRCLVALVLGLMLSCLQADLAQARLRVGVTLHPYYSFVKNIVGDKADVVPIIPGEVNPHGYEPQAEDIKRALDVDVIVVNGIGHDEFIFKIIEASGRKDKLPLIYANASVALIPIGGDQGGEKIVNPHTFISTNAAIQQVYEIARRLGEIEPANAEFYRRNGRDYATKIRQLRAQFMQQIAAHAKDDFRAATMHAGYDYLFQEFGLRISAVVEPRHGVAPTAKQLAQTIADIKAANVSVIFAEQYFGGNLAETVQRETGVRVYTLSHITDGPFTADKFEVEMRQNIETLARALEGK